MTVAAESRARFRTRRSSLAAARPASWRSPGRPGGHGDRAERTARAGGTSRRSDRLAPPHAAGFLFTPRCRQPRPRPSGAKDGRRRCRSPLPASARLARSPSWHGLPHRGAEGSGKSLRRPAARHELQLMTIAVAGAISPSAWFEAATVLSLFALSLALEELEHPAGRAGRSPGPRSRAALGPVWSRRPGNATCTRVGVPGRRASPSGPESGWRSTAGPPPTARRSIQAPITGESRPVIKRRATRSSPVRSTAGAVEIRDHRASPPKRRCWRILRWSKRGAGAALPLRTLGRSFAAVTRPRSSPPRSLVGLPPLVAGASWSGTGAIALVLLVIGCPVPWSSRRRSPSSPASPAAPRRADQGRRRPRGAGDTRAFAFDKTGTLTHGRPRCSKWCRSGRRARGGLERRRRSKRGASIRSPRRCATTPPRVAPPWRRPKSYASRARARQGRSPDAPSGSARTASSRSGDRRRRRSTRASRRSRRPDGPAIVVGNESHVCGLVAVADGVCDGAREIVADLRRLGIETTVMLTGDNRGGTAEAIGLATGMTQVRSELLPHEKVAAIRSWWWHATGKWRWSATGSTTPRLSPRNAFGIAMGGAGSDAAIETADVALLSDDLSRLPWLIGLSRRTLAVIRQKHRLRPGGGACSSSPSPSWAPPRSGQ